MAANSYISLVDPGLQQRQQQQQRLQLKSLGLALLQQEQQQQQQQRWESGDNMLDRLTQDG